MVAIELPLDIYDHLVGCCDPESPVTSILKSGTIIQRPKGRIAEISCQPDEAKILLATATKVCPNAVPSVQSLSAFSTGQTLSPKTKYAWTNFSQIGLVDHRRAPEGSLTVAVRSLDYPETALFMALPRLCISSPMPRTVAHPSRAKTTKSDAQRSKVFFFILPPRP